MQCRRVRSLPRPPHPRNAKTAYPFFYERSTLRQTQHFYADFMAPHHFAWIWRQAHYLRLYSSPFFNLFPMAKVYATYRTATCVRGTFCYVRPCPRAVLCWGTPGGMRSPSNIPYMHTVSERPAEPKFSVTYPSKRQTPTHRFLCSSEGKSCHLVALSFTTPPLKPPHSTSGLHCRSVVSLLLYS